MRVALSHVGCKLNQAELEALARAFQASGHQLVVCPEDADLYVVNTCAVTAEAARDSRRLARRGGSGPRTVLTGCYATLSPSEARRLPGVDLVVPNHHKDRLVFLVGEAFPELEATSPALVSSPPRRVRALVKIQDGCGVGCAFCTVPAARGRPRCRPPHEVLEEVCRVVEAGAQEVVLTGTLISSYEGGGLDLPGLVETLVTRVPVRRLRLSSLSPWRLGKREVAMWQQPRLCRHVHLSLQSGCAATLARMARPCTPAQFAEAVARLRGAIPEMAITTDVIVGYPGETEAEFRESLAFVASMKFARVHVFPFSPRPGTPAANMPGQVPPEVKTERAARLRAVALTSQRAFLTGMVGQRVEVLWERERHGWWEGYTDTYVVVRAACSGAAANTWAWVEVEGVDGGAVRGRVVASAEATEVSC